MRGCCGGVWRVLTHCIAPDAVPSEATVALAHGLALLGVVDAACMLRADELPAREVPCSGGGGRAKRRGREKRP